MTIDERLEPLSERHEALTFPVESLPADVMKMRASWTTSSPAFKRFSKSQATTSVALRGLNNDEPSKRRTRRARYCDKALIGESNHGKFVSGKVR